MRVNALVQSVAKEKEQAEAGKLSQEQMQRFWQTNHSADSLGFMSMAILLSCTGTNCSHACMQGRLFHSPNLAQGLESC